MSRSKNEIRRGRQPYVGYLRSLHYRSTIVDINTITASTTSLLRFILRFDQLKILSQLGRRTFAIWNNEDCPSLTTLSHSFSFSLSLFLSFSRSTYKQLFSLFLSPFRRLINNIQSLSDMKQRARIELPKYRSPRDYLCIRRVTNFTIH